MDYYLMNKFKGTFRILAHYDKNTNDIPRTEDGCYDESFADFYIKCPKKTEIRHGVGSNLSVYIPTKQRGINILKQIYLDKIGNNYPKETVQTQKYYENLCKELKKDVLVDAEVLDSEVIFDFNISMMDYISSLIKPITSGANISPMSIKNIPKSEYNIPQSDLDLYKKATKDFPKIKITSNKVTKYITSGLIVRKMNKDFDKIMLKSKGKNFKIKEDRRKKGLDVKKYIHNEGYWNDYCKFLESEVGKYV
jgi:hypothetical protein